MSPYAGSSRLGATPKRPSHPTLRVRLVDRHTMQVKPRPSYAWLVFGLLMAWLALAPSGASAGKAADAPEGAWVTLDGQRVLEIRIAAGAGTAAETAGRARRELRQLVDDRAVNPDALLVVEDPPYWMVALRQADGSLTPKLGVDGRAARCFGLTQQALALRYPDQIRSAIRTYLNRHSLGTWLRGTALALLVLAIYLGWIRWQRHLHQRLAQRLKLHAPGCGLARTSCCNQPSSDRCLSCGRQQLVSGPGPSAATPAGFLSGMGAANGTDSAVDLVGWAGDRLSLHPGAEQQGLSGAWPVCGGSWRRWDQALWPPT
jgi:hypothetical protein